MQVEASHRISGCWHPKTECGGEESNRVMGVGGNQQKSIASLALFVSIMPCYPDLLAITKQRLQRIDEQWRRSQMMEDHHKCD